MGVTTKELLGALARILPMARACKYEDFSDMQGNEDTKTEALKHAVLTMRKADGKEDARVEKLEEAITNASLHLCESQVPEAKAAMKIFGEVVDTEARKRMGI